MPSLPGGWEAPCRDFSNLARSALQPVSLSSPDRDAPPPSLTPPAFLQWIHKSSHHTHTTGLVKHGTEKNSRDSSHGLRVSPDSDKSEQLPRDPDRSPFPHYTTSPYHNDSPALLHLWAANSHSEEDVRDPWMEAACEQVTKFLSL